MIRIEEREEQLELNMAPMIDMVFLLIIFFLTTTTFTDREKEQDILLPTTRGSGSLSRSPENKLIINVLQDGSLSVLGATVAPEELERIVRDRRERSRQTLKVMVRADRRTLYGSVAKALATVEQAGVQRPYVMTRTVEMEP